MSKPTGRTMRNERDSVRTATCSSETDVRYLVSRAWFPLGLHVINLEHLHAFAALAETLNFRLAAERLKISQPTLTTRLQQFEAFAGVIFFDRTSRQVLLTQAGEEFLPTAIQLINDFDSYLSRVSDFAQRRSGLVRVAALYSVATVLLPEVVKKFASAHPHVRFELRDDNSAENIRRVLRGEVDFGISHHQGDQPDLKFTPLFRDKLVVAFHKDHPLAAYDEVPLAAMAHCNFIGFGKSTGPGQWLGHLREMPDNMRFPGIVVWNTPTLEALLSVNAGVTVLPKLAMQNWHLMNLTSRNIAARDTFRDVYLISLRGKTISPSAELFRQSLIADIRAYAETNDLLIPGSDRAGAGNP